MVEQFNRALGLANARIVEAVGNFLPGVLVFLVVLAVTLAVALVLRSTVRGTIRVHPALKPGRAITLCWTAKRARSAASIARACEIGPIALAKLRGDADAFESADHLIPRPHFAQLAAGGAAGLDDDDRERAAQVVSHDAEHLVPHLNSSLGRAIEPSVLDGERRPVGEFLGYAHICRLIDPGGRDGHQNNRAQELPVRQRPVGDGEPGAAQPHHAAPDDEEERERRRTGEGCPAEHQATGACERPSRGLVAG